jgi:hypothetical protein
MEEIIGTNFQLYNKAPFPFSKVVNALKRKGFDIKSIPNINYKVPTNYVSLRSYKSLVMSTGLGDSELQCFLDYIDPELLINNTVSFSYEYDFNDIKNIRTLFETSLVKKELAYKLQRISEYLAKLIGSKFYVKKVVSSFDFQLLDFGLFSFLKNKGEFIIVTILGEGHYGYNLNFIFEIKDDKPISVTYYETLEIYKSSLKSIMETNFPIDEDFDKSLELLDMLSV